MMFTYAISPKTDIMLALQGFPGFEFKYKDFVQTDNDFKQKLYMLQIQNRTTYFGYDIWASTGILYDEKEFADLTREFENRQTSVIFVKVFLGW